MTLCAWALLLCGVTEQAKAIPFDAQAPITWEQMRSVEAEVASLPANLIVLYSKLDLKRLTPSQKAYLRERLKKISGWPMGYLTSMFDRELTMLVQLGDEETTKWLLSELKKGGGTSAGLILGESGVASLLPRLEQYAFWPEDKEPRYPIVSDVTYASVRSEAIRACHEIVANSPEFTPKCKTWFAFLGVVPAYPKPERSQAILRQWWNENRKRLAAGQFKHLSLPALWPGGATFSDAKTGRFEREDYLAAVHSDLGEVRYHALKRLESDWLADLAEGELREIAASMSKPYGRAREQTAILLAKAGPLGIAELRKLLDHVDAEIRACAAIGLLGTAPAAGADRSRCLSEILDGAGGGSKVSPDFLVSNFILEHTELKDELMPLMRRHILDQKGAADARLSLLFLFSFWVSNEDEALLEQLLSKEEPIEIRGAAYRILRNRHQTGVLPASVAELVNDPAFAKYSEGFRN